MKILIDNGHGSDTAGKCSPDGKLREYAYAREIAKRIVTELKARGYDAERIVTEDNDIGLATRCKRVNSICNKLGAKNVVFVSIHVNAKGCGDWEAARGWSAYTSKGQTSGDKVADYLYAEAEKNFQDLKIRKDMSDGDPDIEEGFYVLKHTQCAAVLTENFFQDNKEDVEYLLSEEGKAAIVKTHVDALAKYTDDQTKK